MGRSNRKQIVTRLAKLLAMCQRYRYLPPLDELGQRLRAHPRTIRRDLEALEEAGIVVPQRLDQLEEVL